MECRAGRRGVLPMVSSASDDLHTRHRPVKQFSFHDVARWAARLDADFQSHFKQGRVVVKIAAVDVGHRQRGGRRASAGQ